MVTRSSKRKRGLDPWLDDAGTSMQQQDMNIAERIDT